MMTLDTLVLEIRQLPLVARLMLVEAIAESIRQELVTAAEKEPPVAKLEVGMLRTGEPIPTDEEIKEGYTRYLIDKYS